jgi:hypothetical protein
VFAAAFSLTRSARHEHEQAKTELNGLMSEDAKGAINAIPNSVEKLL